ncbi:hypothetical protein V6076_06740, partial [Klebsiella pneumoniae]
FFSKQKTACEFVPGLGGAERCKRDGRRLGSFPPGRVKAGVLCCPRGRGGLAFVFQDIQLSPPLDKALHDLS